MPVDIGDHRSHAEALTDLSRICEEAGYPAVIIGGVAVSLLARARATTDADALCLIGLDQAEHLFTKLRTVGFELLFPDSMQIAKRLRVLPLAHLPTKMRVDLAFGCMPLEIEIVERSTTMLAEPIRLRLPTPEDLIILKAIAHRDKDMVDIRTVAEVYPDLDKDRIRYWVTEYADLLDEPDLWPRVEKLITVDF